MIQIDQLRQKIFEKDTSSSFKEYLKLLHSDVLIRINCSLGMDRIVIPVRHRTINSNCCIFDLNNICEFIEETPPQGDQIQCPACRAYLSVTDFGVDRFFYHIISQITYQKLDNEELYQKRKIHYSISQRKFYVLKLEGGERIEILGVNYRQKVANPMLIVEWLEPIKNILLRRIQNCTTAANNFGIKQSQGLIQEKALLALKEVEQMIFAKMGVRQQGRQEFLKTEDFCFGLLKRFPNAINQSKSLIQQEATQSVLITYHPKQEIWHDYLLKSSEQKDYDFMHNEAALALKSISTEHGNSIFILGGFERKKKISTQDFFRIKMIKNPFDESQQALVVERLPDLPYACSLPIGVYDNGRIYLLGGANYLSSEDIQIKSDVHIYENGQWSQSKCQLPNPRIDGTIHFNKEAKIVTLIGGYRIKQNKCDDKDQEQVTKIDMLFLKDFRIKVIDINFGLIESRILTNKCLNARMVPNELELLIFNGKSLGENLNQTNFRPQVISMQYRIQEQEAFLSLHQEFSSKSVYVLDRVGSSALHQMNDVRSMMLIHDYEGVMMDNVFYTIYCRPDNFQNQHAPQNLQICAYQYDLKSGNSTLYKYMIDSFNGYQLSSTTIVSANQFLQTLNLDESQVKSFQELV